LRNSSPALPEPGRETAAFVGACGDQRPRSVYPPALAGDECGLQPAGHAHRRGGGKFLQANVEHSPWARLLACEGLSGDKGDANADDAYFRAMVDDVRRRQLNCELTENLDPAYALLVLFAAALAPSVIPQIVRRITGERADSRSSCGRTPISYAASSNTGGQQGLQIWLCWPETCAVAES
jgi:hypothetical protein